MMYPPPPSNMPVSPYFPAPAPVTSEEGPLPTPLQGLWPGRYNKVAGIVLIVMVLVAVIAAVAGPLLVYHTAESRAPSSWSQVYSSNLQNTSDWTGDGGCTANSSGLDVTSDAGGWDTCTYTPSTTTDLVSQGFQLNVSLAPESQLQQPLTPLIQAGDSSGDGFSVIIDDAGDFAICQDSSSDCSTCLSGGSIGSCDDALASDSTDAWHTDSYVANTLSIRYQPLSDSSGVLSVFANGQEVASGSLPSGLPSGLTISIGSGNSGEALYTGATIYAPAS